MCKFRTSLLIFAVIIFSCRLQANYQPEHYEEFDETMRHQFMHKQDSTNQFDQQFFTQLPFQPLLQGMLQGIMPYQCMQIDCDGASPYVLIKSTASYAYLAGKPNNKQLAAVVQGLSDCKKGLVLICDESLHSHFVQHGFGMQPRIEFTFDFHHKLLQKDLPAGFIVQRLDLKLLRQSPWYGFIASVHAGSQGFLDKCFGFALVDEQGVSVAQAYGAFISDAACEIGVVTHPDHRGKGYILYPAIATIQEVLARGLTPVWSCNSENIASIKTAHKLGFSIKRHYAFLKKF